MKSRIKKKKMRQQEQLRRIEKLEAMLDNCMKEIIRRDRVLEDMQERLSHNTFVTNQNFEQMEKKIAELSSKTKKWWFNKCK